MTTRSFSSFSEASEFAKKTSKKYKVNVRLFKRSDDFLVDGNFSIENVEKVAVVETPATKAVVSVTSNSTLASSQPHTPLPSDIRLCVDCASIIPRSRVLVTPDVCRCLKCQSAYEKTHDTRSRRNEGFGGTREENIRMRFRGGS